MHVAGRVMKQKRSLAKWLSPPSGRLKVNVDGSFRSSHGDGGVGVVIRDEGGSCLVAAAHHYAYAASVVHMEAEAARAGILLALQHSYDTIDLECDNSMVVNLLLSGMEDRSEIGCIIGDCKSYLTCFRSIQVSHVFREANGVANRLAHLASGSNINEVWLGEAPAIIRDVLYEDGCNIARG